MSINDSGTRLAWDEAVKVLYAAGYHLEHVASDQWLIRFRTHYVAGAIVREATLIALAETLQRVVQRPEWRW